MVRVTQRFLDTPIVHLEGYGLNMRVINALEQHFGVIYIHQLKSLTNGDLCRTSYAIGERGLAELIDTLRLYKNDCLNGTNRWRQPTF